MHAEPHAERSGVKGRPETVDGVPRAGGWSNRTSCGDKARLSVSVHATAEPSRLVTYDNATVGAAAVRQLHKRASRGRFPARRGLSRYLPAILLFARSLFFPSRHLSWRCLGVSILGRIRVRVNTPNFSAPDCYRSCVVVYINGPVMLLLPCRRPNYLWLRKWISDLALSVMQIVLRPFRVFGGHSTGNCWTLML